MRTAVVQRLDAAVVDVVRRVAKVLTAAQAVQARLESAGDDPAVEDARLHLQSLVYPGFVTDTGRSRLADLVRYVTAIDRRLDKVRSDPDRDRALSAQISVVEDEFLDLRLRTLRVDDATVAEIRWMIEELRVSLYAQQLGTRYPISDTRIFKAIARAGSRG